MDILDSTTTDEFRSMINAYLRSEEGFILVFSINLKSSFNELREHYKQILLVKDIGVGGRVPIVLVGNKCDRESQRQVTTEEARILANEWNVPYFETSAKTRINIDECFYEMVREMRYVRSPVLKKEKKNPSSKARGNCNLV